MKKQSFPRSQFAILILLLILFVITISLYYFKPIQELDDEISFPDNYVVRVIDGDTFEIYSGEIVRLICLDTPELGDAGSYEAKDFLESLILDKEIRMEKDVNDKDKYGRLLRYVWVSSSLGFNESYEDEVFVNKILVEKGYANVFRYGDDVKRCGEIGG